MSRPLSIAPTASVVAAVAEREDAAGVFCFADSSEPATWFAVIVNGMKIKIAYRLYHFLKKIKYFVDFLDKKTVFTILVCETTGLSLWWYDVVAVTFLTDTDTPQGGLFR